MLLSVLYLASWSCCISCVLIVNCMLIYFRSEVVKEAIHKQGLKDPISVSLANDNSVDASGMRSSPCLTDGGDSLAQASPPSASICLMSTSDSSNIVQNNSSCSPDLRVHQKITLCAPVVDKEGKSELVVTHRPKSVGRNAEAHAALSSFEAMLGTLTRTKESIGRATRVAIDCAKFGVASKVGYCCFEFTQKRHH